MQVRNRVVVSFHNLYTTPPVPSAPPTAVHIHQHHSPVGGRGLHKSQWKHNRILTPHWKHGKHAV